jgi:hypothetical protein
MVKILKNEGNVIIYECDCGVRGKCMVKPLEKEAAIVVDVRCPVCFAVERTVLVQYESEEEKFKIKNSLNDAELSWSPILSNEITEYFLKKDED